MDLEQLEVVEEVMSMFSMLNQEKVMFATYLLKRDTKA